MGSGDIIAGYIVPGLPHPYLTPERSAVWQDIRDSFDKVRRDIESLDADMLLLYSDGLTVATCLSLRHMRPELHIVAECVDPDNREILSRAGCRSIVCVLDLGPGILAQELHDPGVVDVLHELTVWHDDINNVYILPVELTGPGTQTVEALRRWADHHDATVLGLRRGTALSLNPRADHAVHQGDAVVHCWMHEHPEARCSWRSGR